ncbi:PTS galactitol transporter subunit IIC [Bombilactobacillus bombi]|uniref:PTS galactitol transporter subunit IIC n=1 Tax=Bombilactobacillus bombi TaxID=1303590 RepID=A0A3R6V0C8_9LACO|nr:PTS transporter subunit IIC [Bombilactobacillus bombi]RHW52289.1 PTS galactitol transporter subunit IIC [Bombilactobacillus bombi]
MSANLESGFNFFIGLGGPAIMFIVLTLLALLFGVSLSKSLEGGLRMAVALTGMSAVISLLTEAFGPALKHFVASTGIQLSITDLGWAPLAVITWGSMYTLYFALICFALNIVLLLLNVTETLNVDLFNIWNVSILGLLINFYAHNIVISSIFVLFIYTLMLLNSDAMKPTIDELLNYEQGNISTTAHPSLLIAPVIFLINWLITKLFPFIDKFDFDADTLNKKIGFWGSKFAIGAYLGVFIGILGQQSVANVFKLAFTGGVALELFSLVGDWFGPAIEPLSGGVQTFMGKRLRGRRLLIAIDWPLVASRAEVWAVANILAPILLIIAIILPGNKVMPLGGILMTVLTPALLIVTKGKVIRMTLIGTILIPVYLWSATLVAKFITQTSVAMNNIPKGFGKGQLFTSIDSDPLEKIFAVICGQGINSLDLQKLAISFGCLIVYLVLFAWYYKQMKKRTH